MVNGEFGLALQFILSLLVDTGGDFFVIIYITTIELLLRRTLVHPVIY
jgi:hypothetical protein